MRPDDEVCPGVGEITYPLHLEGVLPHAHALEAELAGQVRPGRRGVIQCDPRAGNPLCVIILHHASQRPNAEHRDSFQRQSPTHNGIVAGVGEPGGRRDGVAGVIDRFIRSRDEQRLQTIHRDDARESDTLASAVSVIRRFEYVKTVGQVRR